MVIFPKKVPLSIIGIFNSFAFKSSISSFLIAALYTTTSALAKFSKSCPITTLIPFWINLSVVSDAVESEPVTWNPQNF